MNIDASEQWKLSGDCDKCRKQKYCGKPCTARGKFIQRKALEYITEKISERRLENDN